MCDASLRNAAIEAREENEGNTDISAALTWQKRGHTSMNGLSLSLPLSSGL